MWQGGPPPNAEAMCSLGVAFMTGARGVAADPTVAVAWLARAQLFPSLHLNFLLNLSPAHPFIAVPMLHPPLLSPMGRWLRAAEQGNANAQYNLSKALQHGQGCTRSPKDALRWCQAAAAQGHPQVGKARGGL